jgi:hypothetical protein
MDSAISGTSSMDTTVTIASAAAAVTVHGLSLSVCVSACAPERMKASANRRNSLDLDIFVKDMESIRDSIISNQGYGAYP